MIFYSVDSSMRALIFPVSTFTSAIFCVPSSSFLIMFRMDVRKSSITSLSSSSGNYYKHIIHHLNSDCFFIKFFWRARAGLERVIDTKGPPFNACAASTIANNAIKSIISVANGVNLTSRSSFIIGFLFEHSPHSHKIVII